MRLLHLTILLLSWCTATFAQSETEPNNTFATAGNFPGFNTYTASIGAGDTLDCHRVNMTTNANFYLLVEATNNSGANAYLEMKMYDGRQATGLLLTRTIGNNLDVPDGETVYDTIYVCAKAIDDYYLTFTTNESFDYQLQWFPVAAYETDEPNNQSGAAIPFPMHVYQPAAIQYEFRGGVNDTEDWFQSGVLPAVDYSKVNLYLEAWNSRCSGGPGSISYMCFKSPNLVTPFAQGFIGATNAVPAGVTVNSVVPLSNMQAGDIFYIRLTSTGPFGYTLRYSNLAPFSDMEDNCCTYNAIHLDEDSTVGGKVGEFDYPNDVYTDEYDTYRFILPQPGAIKIFTAAEMANCDGAEDPYLGYEILDKYGNTLPLSNSLTGWTGTPACGSLQMDTIKIRAFEADTFYLRLKADRAFGNYPIINYNIRYEYADICLNNDTEPNNDTATAISINAGELKKGHINFNREMGSGDFSDYYKAIVPADGKMTVYIKGTYRGETIANNSNSFRLGVNYTNNNVTTYVPAQAKWPFLYPDSVFLDTIYICPVIEGTAFFRLVANRAFEYEVSYSISDTSSWPVDPEYNNLFTGAVVPVAEQETKKGRLMYYPDRYLSISDNADIYKTVLAKDGAVKIYVEAKNMTCGTANPLELRCYDRRNNFGNIFTRNIGNLTSVPPGVAIYDTILVCGQAADTFYFRFGASQQFRYQFRYEIVDTSLNDTEPNGSFALATPVGSAQTKHGHIEYEFNGTSDGLDFYRLTFGSNDSLKLAVQGTNMKCTNGERLTFRLYNKNLSQILSRNIGNTTNVLAGQTVYDTLRIAVTAPDTVYIRVEATDPFRYQFTVNALKPTSGYSISGDTAVCMGTQVYRAHNITDTGIVYNWSLPLGGGSITATDSTATVNWTSEGNRRVQLVLTNAAGNSTPRILNVVINGSAPTQVPVVLNFARSLSTSSLPPGSYCQWYRNDTLIAGATGSTYYAAAAGTYSAKFVNDCGPGTPSNTYNFPAAAQSQTISFPHVPAVTMSPTAKARLTAAASSGLPVYYQKISGPGTIVNDTLFVTGVGAIIVRATQPGDDVYNAAAPVNDTITVIKGNQVITFDSIPHQILGTPNFIVPGSVSSNLPVVYTVVTGTAFATVNNLSGTASSITKKGAGVVTVRATQPGNDNYNAAAPVDRTFCIGIRTLTPITGSANPCIATYRYNTQKIPGASFVWTLSGGGLLTTSNDTAWVQWQTPGSYTLKVKANTGCDTVYTTEQVLNITTSSEVPGAVSGMLPANNSTDRQLPLTLSWIPGSNTVNYDLYIWDSAAAEPTVPYASNISAITSTIPKNAPFPYNRTYKWRIVAKNPCAQTPGPVQQFRLIPLPDLVVSDIQAPAAAVSGQTITISWKVTNIGPGKTLPGQYWRDGVYFALDTVPQVSFTNSPDWNTTSWNSLTANGRPLLLGYKDRPAALDSGQFYTNSISFTLPLGYNFPVYVYVISPNNNPNGPILQASVINDTARAPNRITITQPPTPDLRVDSVFVPGSTFSGSTINLTYKVKNYGVVTPAANVWNDSVFISQSPLFNRDQAIPLNTPKQNGSYYPNAPGAAVYNNTQLNAGSTVTRNLQVVVPNYILGTWFIYVKTNANTANGGFVYEGALNNNNMGQAQLQVYLTPTPKLTVNNLTVAVTSASTTQPVGANWSIINEGFRDNIEKNKGHILGFSSCGIPCSNGCSNCACTAVSIEKDSIAFGGSYWTDRVYLSTDSTGLNTAASVLVSEVKHGTENSGLFADAPLPQNSYESCPAITNSDINTSNVIQPGSAFPKSAGFIIPAGLPSGNYYVYVYTNPGKNVYEYPGTPQIKRTALPILVQRPDITVAQVTAPASATGTQTITLNYTVLNNGPGSVFSHLRRDRLYISNFSSFEGNAQLIATNNFTEDIPAGAGVAHTFSYTLPAATSGVRYFYIITNYDSLFKETGYANNLSAPVAVSVSAALPADLVVSAVQPKDSVFTIFPTAFKYTVTNNGTGSTTGRWTDSLFISCHPAFNSATAKFITRRVHSRNILPGGNYTDSFALTIPEMSYETNTCFPQQMYAPGYFFIKTNADSGTYEGAGINNNTGGSGSRVIVNPLADHIITTASVNKDTLMVGVPFTANWKIKNIGYKPPYQYYNNYSDGVFLSPDSIVSTTDARAGSYFKYSTINRNDSLLESRSVTVPNLATGDYYLYITTNYTDGIKGEKNTGNNTNFVRNTVTQAARKIHVVRPPLSDLAASIIAAPESAAVGQPVTVVYKITNTGTGITFPGAWQNDLRLSPDFQAQNNAGDRILATKTRNMPLGPGQSFLDTVTGTIPAYTAAGNYVLIARANSNNAVTEINNANNLGFSLIDVYLPDSADLIVTGIQKPDTVYLGYTIDTAKWVLQNTSGADAVGYVTDGLYLSAGNLFDSTAALLGTQYRRINLQPLETDTVRLAPLVTAATEGNYNLFARTDLLNNMIELDKGNNTTISAAPIYVKAKELRLNIPESNTLHKLNRYYKLRVPGSLLGATILVTLKTNDSLTVRNELYISGGVVPTAAAHDYRFETPNYGNQQIVIHTVTDTVYYIMYRCVTANAPVQDMVLKAEVLPFAILNVQTGSGGNIGNVTVRIRGTLFSDSMVARLTNATDTIYAAAVYYTNSTQVFATFPLQGKPLGVYNVTLMKPDSSVAVLANGFTVTNANNGGLITGGGVNTGSGNGNTPGCDPGAPSGLNAQLVLELLVPNRVLITRPVVLVLNYTNPTNVDIPAQTRIIYSDSDVKMALTRAGVPAGTTALYIELTEPGGPPGIIRAGGGGTVLIYCNAPKEVPQPKGHVEFKIK